MGNDSPSASPSQSTTTRSWLARKLLAGRELIADILFPLQCFGCESHGTLACATCLEDIPEREYQECPICRKPYQKNGATCRSCRSQTSLDGLFIARPYHHPLLKKLIFALKYRFIRLAADPVAHLLAESIAHHPFPLPDLIIPVPLHPRRLRFRGFNQAELIARKLMARLLPGTPIPLHATLLQRQRFTKPQMKTDSKIERQANLASAFVTPIETAGPLVGKYIWLIDDVATTGTTLDECARTLKKAGAKTVWGVVVAR